MGTSKVKTPAPRDYKSEMMGALKAQLEVQPMILDAERMYQPMYQQLQQQGISNQMNYQLDSYGKAIPRSAELSGQFNEAMSPVYGRMGELANQAYQQGLGADTMGLYNTMNRQAQAGLDAGYGLTPDMERQAQQSARAAMTARGLAGGGQGVAAEVLNSYDLGNKRYQQSLQNAQSAYNLGSNQFANALNAYGTPMLNQSTTYSPANLYTNAYNATQSAGRVFSPESQYNAGLISANRKEAMDVQIANAQMSNSLTSGLISGGAKIAAAAI